MIPPEQTNPATTDGYLRDALVQVSYTVIDAVSRVATHHDLSLTLLRVLAILRDRTPTMSGLATHLDLDRSSITGLVDRAVTRGLMEKVPDDRDRRSRRVALTDRGHALARECVAEITDALTPLISQLTVPQRGQLTRLLTALGVAY
jgi:DNA-binding MarR family transcriptional regulator